MSRNFKDLIGELSLEAQERIKKEAVEILEEIADKNNICRVPRIKFRELTPEEEILLKGFTLSIPINVKNISIQKIENIRRKLFLVKGKLLSKHYVSLIEYQQEDQHNSSLHLLEELTLDSDSESIPSDSKLLILLNRKLKNKKGDKEK
ncbi:hypothetical protein V6O07_00470 [Arthrospira platensis SPKY2]